MIGDFFFTYLVHSTVLLVAAGMLVRLGPGAAERASVWRLALVLGIASSLVRVGLEPGNPAVLELPTLAEMGPVLGVGGPAPGIVGPFRAGVTERQTWEGLLITLWAVGASLGILRFLLARRRLARALGRAPEHDQARLALVREIGSLFRRSLRPTVSRSKSLVGPVVLGRRELCLPDTFDELPLGQRRSLLAHELAHLERRDPLWRSTLHLLARVLFFQPLNLWALSRWEDEAERACDRRAVSATGQPEDLARALATLAASHVRHLRVGLAARGGGDSALISRVRAILGGESTPRRRASVGALSIALTLVALPLPGAILDVRGAEWGGDGTRLVSGRIAEVHRDRRIEMELRRVVLDSGGSFAGVRPGGWLRVVETRATRSRDHTAEAGAEAVPPWVQSLFTEFLDN